MNHYVVHLKFIQYCTSTISQLKNFFECLFKKKASRKNGWQLKGDMELKQKRERKLWFGQNNNPVLSETLSFPLLTIVHALNHWSTDKMVAFINQYWLGTINKAAKTAYLTYPICLKYNPRKHVCTAPKISNCLMEHSRSGRWISYNCVCLMDINIF